MVTFIFELIASLIITGFFHFVLYMIMMFVINCMNKSSKACFIPYLFFAGILLLVFISMASDLPENAKGLGPLLVITDILWSLFYGWGFKTGFDD